LTGNDAHHRYRNGQIEHAVGNRDTLYYPSGDDHPSETGSQKATEEFIPLLNVVYNRWKASAPLQPSAESLDPAGEPSQETTDETLPQSPAPAGQGAAAALIDDFEVDNPPGTNGWEPFWDEATPTSMHCAAKSGMANGGSHALILDFDVSPNAWGTCALFYDSLQDWGSSEGLTFYLRATQPGLVFDVNLHAGSPDSQETYLFTIEAPQDSIDSWAPVTLYWSDFHRANWEENAGDPLAKPDQITGIAFGMNADPDTPNTGTLWVDDLSLLGSRSTPGAQPAAESDQPEAEEPARRRSLPCGSAFALPIMLIVLWIWSGRRWF